MLRRNQEGEAEPREYDHLPLPTAFKKGKGEGFQEFAAIASHHRKQDIRLLKQAVGQAAKGIHGSLQAD